MRTKAQNIARFKICTLNHITITIANGFGVHTTNLLNQLQSGAVAIALVVESRNLRIGKGLVVYTGNSNIAVPALTCHAFVSIATYAYPVIHRTCVEEENSAICNCLSIFFHAIDIYRHILLLLVPNTHNMVPLTSLRNNTAICNNPVR